MMTSDTCTFVEYVYGINKHKNYVCIKYSAANSNNMYRDTYVYM